ncbi:cytochrome P450 [Actinosynnema sp. NPDC020468]|uniref:cytochrome P450 n=1 Tax=Actinosynnema sp. NPDC020468 TaxID=3154488 RepID=UPI0033C18C32
MSGRRKAPGPFFDVLVSFARNPLRLVTRLRDRHGPLARVRMGPFTVHQVSGPEQIRHVLQTNARNYVRGRFYRGFHLFFGRGMLTTDGAEWKARRAASQPLFHKPRLRAESPTITAMVGEVLDGWDGRMRRGEPVEVTEEMMRLAMGVLGTLLYGVDLRRHADDLLPAVRFAMEAGNNANPLRPLAPGWKRRLARHQAVLNRVMDEVIDRHEAGAGAPDGLVAALASATGPDGKPFGRREIRSELKTVFLAGHETTGCALAWTLHALANHEPVREKVAAELAEVLDGRVPTAEDVADLPYLRQVVDESLRLYPPIWLFPRDAVADDVIGGCPVPAGSTVLVPPYAAHRDPAVWDRPEEFDPERFGPGRKAPDRHAYLPFGGGARKCVGMDLALLELHLVVAMVAQRFRLTPVSAGPVVPDALVSLRPPRLEMRLSPA